MVLLLGAWEVMLRCSRFDVGATGDEMERIGRKWRKEKRQRVKEREIYFEKNPQAVDGMDAGEVSKMNMVVFSL